MRELGDPAGWNTGLSPEGARTALRVEIECIEAATPRTGAPRRVAIWCSQNVFVAPLRWIERFTALGCEVVLKAPTRRPEAYRAIGAAYGVRVVEAPHDEALGLLEDIDALLGFGSDAAMARLDAVFEGPKALFGHRVSFALVEDISHEVAHALAMDAALHDGAGCRSPAAVFCLGDAERLAMRVAQGLRELAISMPRGEVDPALGPEWRRRCGLGRVRGRCWSGHEWAVPFLAVEHLAPSPLPRLLPVHPIASLDELDAALAGLPLGACATDVEPRGFRTLCRPGELQRPPDDGCWEGVDVVQRLLS